MTNLALDLTNTIATGLTKRSIKKCSIWAEECRKIGDNQWSFRHYPWLKELHDLNDQECYAQKGAQIGFTEFAINRAIYYVDQIHKDVLYILPNSQPDAGDFSLARFNPALEASPYLSSIFTSTRNVGLKRSTNGAIYIRGSRSEAQMRSIPVGLLIMDEIDLFAQRSIALARERLSGQLNFQLWGISTPRIPDKGINLLYEASTQEHFTFRCPSCSRFTTFTFPESLVITAEHYNDPAVLDSYYVCRECGAKLPHEAKPEFLADAIWVPQYPGRITRGFHINQMYSYTVTPGQLAIQRLKALNDEVEEQEFYNSKLGLPHIVKGSRVDTTMIESAKGDYRNGTPSGGTGFRTCGIDVGNWLHIVVQDWKFDSSVKSTDINAQARSRLLYADKVETFDEIPEILEYFKVRKTVIDANPARRAALSLARRFPGFIYLCFYIKNMSGRDISVNDEEFRVSVDRTTWLDTSLARYKHNSIVIPYDLPQEFSDHITALVKVPLKDNDGERFYKYENTRADHYAHAQNYSEIALKLAATQGDSYNIGWS